MSGDHTNSGDLKEAVVRICPACGVVNPAGPSETCPHLQLARFNGLDNGLALLLSQVAEARRHFVGLVDDLKLKVKQAIHCQQAEVETPRRARFSEVEALRPRPQPSPVLSLENPESPPVKHRETRRRTRKPAQTPPVDPRQLALIAQEPPKGDA
ncbi:MAG: hypothetical protein GY847_41695 [Proteobacteria bacterium]|nr:hypothetical protein [Pseudomonadota bacterium]